MMAEANRITTLNTTIRQHKIRQTKIRDCWYRPINNVLTFLIVHGVLVGVKEYLT